MVHKPGTLNRADAFSRWPDHDNGASDNEDVVVLGPELFTNAAEILDLEQEVFTAQKEHEDEMKRLQEGFSLNKLDEKWFYHGRPVVPEEENLRRRLLFVTFTASFDAKGLAATGSGSRIRSARVTDRLQGPDVRWIAPTDTPRIGSEMQQRWMVMARDHSCGEEREGEREEEVGRLQGTN